MQQPDGGDTLRLLSLGSFYGAYACASTAIDALISINNSLSVTFADTLNGALADASTAVDAIVCDLVSHCLYLHFFFIVYFKPLKKSDNEVIATFLLL